MCGIAGIFSEVPPLEGIIKDMTDALAHRGPDAHDYYCRGNLALGHRRLSIIDLDKRSNQPFYSRDQRYVMVYNGEIYNYKAVRVELLALGVVLRTSSDTEILLEAFAIWGTGFIHKMQGMFAFAIYDSQLDKLFIYRDRVGKKPLYYFLADKIFLFASEIKALLKHPIVASNLKINRSVISDFLQLGYIPEPNTFYEGVFKFPAGHYGIVSRDYQPTLLPYWNVLHYLRTSRQIKETAAFNELRDLIHESVKSRLVADVPVGVFLSGGVDSSVVTAVASKFAKLKTFSIGFKEGKFNESDYAARVAKYLGTEHYQYILSEQDAVELVDQYLTNFDEPFADTSALPTMLVSQCARKEVTVALTGDGGDELFLGYGAYAWAERLGNPALKTLKPVIRQLMNLVPSPRWKRAVNLLDDVKPEQIRRHIFSQEQYFFSDFEIRSRVFREREPYSESPPDDFRHLSFLSYAELQALFDFQNYLKDDLLVKVDRASMNYGLECRCPLLDHRLVEFAFNLPKRLKKKGSKTKYLLKKVLFDMVPEKYFDRPKSGFSIPLAQWMKKDLNYLYKYISEEEIERTGIFDSNYVRSLLQKFERGEDYLYNRLWVVIIIQRFLISNMK